MAEEVERAGDDARDQDVVLVTVQPHERSVPEPMPPNTRLPLAPALDGTAGDGAGSGTGSGSTLPTTRGVGLTTTSDPSALTTVLPPPPPPATEAPTDDDVRVRVELFVVEAARVRERVLT